MVTNELVLQVIEDTFKEVINLRKTKGEDYTKGTGNAWWNFETVAAQKKDMKPEDVWFVYFFKHYSSLLSYLEGIYKNSEPIEGRIDDMIVYLLLLKSKIINDKNNTDINRKTIDLIVS